MLSQRSKLEYPQISNGDQEKTEREYNDDVINSETNTETNNNNYNLDGQLTTHRSHIQSHNPIQQAFIVDDMMPCNTQESMIEHDQKVNQSLTPSNKSQSAAPSSSHPQNSYRNIDWNILSPTIVQKSARVGLTRNGIGHSSFKSRLEKISQPDFRMNTRIWQRIFMYDYLKILIHLYHQFRQAMHVDVSTLPRLQQKGQIDTIYKTFSDIYFSKEEQKIENNSVMNANDLLSSLLRTFRSAFIRMALQLILFFSLKFASSLFLRELLNALSSGNAEQVEIYMWTVSICISMTLVSMVDQHYGRDLVVVYQSLRVIIMKHIHAKVASLSYFTISQNNVGKILNLVSNDLKVLETKTGEIIKLPILPFPTIAVAAISYYRYGVYSLAGLSFMLICVPIQTLLAKLSKKFFLERANANDKRIQLVNEVLEGIRLIKLYSWEDAFLKMLSILRSTELLLLLRTKLIQVIESSLSLSSGIVSCFFMFFLVFQYGDPSTLTLANMYSTLDIFLFLRQEVISISGIGITGLLELKVVMKRIINILNIESIEMLSLDCTYILNQLLSINFSLTLSSFLKSTIETENQNLNTEAGGVIMVTEGITDIETHPNNNNNKIPNIPNLVIQQQPQQQQQQPQQQLEVPLGAIKLQNVTAYWKQGSPVLENINIDISPGQLITIIGSVSSGKSSLLSCFTSEMPYYRGHMGIRGKVAFVEQEPFIFNLTIQENILFGLEYDQYLYHQVLDASDLKRDIDNYPLGDETMVGEKGGNLSGGQRARLSLARALYSNADIYLLDDPLSALDVRVAKVIFQKAVKTFLKGKTILLVTHSRDFMEQSDLILGMVDGSIYRQGTPIEMQDYLIHIKATKKPQLTLLKKTKQQLGQDELTPLNSPRAGRKNNLFQSSSRRDISFTNQLIPSSNHVGITSSNGLDSSNSLSYKPPSISHSYQQIFNIASPNSVPFQQQHGQQGGLSSFHLTLAKTSSVSKHLQSHRKQSLLSSNNINASEDKCDVTLNTYKQYLKYSNYRFLLPICLLLFMSCEVTYILFTKTIGRFSTNHFDEYDSLINQLGYYSAGYFVNMVLKRYLLSMLANDINFTIHQELLRIALNARISYFDKTPTGSILNRFSTDLSVLDSDLSKVMTESVEVVCNSLTLIVTIVLMNPYFLIIAVLCAIILGIFFRLAKDVLIKTKQFDLACKSSVFSFFNMSIQGIMPIKIYCQASNFGIQFNSVLNESLRTSFSYWFSTRGFGMYIIFIAQIASIIGIFLALIVSQDGSTMGSMITFFISLGYKLQSGLRQLIQLDVVMSSAERIFSFMNIPVEPPARLDYDKCLIPTPTTNQSLGKPRSRSNTATKQQPEQPTIAFPQHGKVEFKNVYMSYRDDNKPVLRGVSFVAPAGTKVALIGRTGAGKSSILQALFRMFELIKQNTLPSQQLIPVQTVNNQKKMTSLNNIVIDTEAKETDRQGEEDFVLDQDKSKAKVNVVSPPPGSIVFRNDDEDENADMDSINGDFFNDGDGNIKIDGHYIDSMGLKTLRDGITIIPQVPFIFTGTIRVNIDPQQKYSDEQIWAALKEVGLFEKVDGMPAKLDTEISNSSDAFSAGHKQMICLVRAILKKTKLLILDEITSNIDVQTEEWIQQKIRENFPESTIITIAHRLLTIADYDKVVVLEAGRVAERGSPAVLLSNPDGIFTQMVNSTGEVTSNIIRQIANSKTKGGVTLKSAL